MTPEETRNLVESTADLSTTYLGTQTSKLGIEENTGIPDERRIQHVFSVGSTGSGKTQTMVHAALQDAYKNRGFCVLIPKGNAINELLRKLPENRLDDVILIDPGTDHAPSINVLETYTSEEMTEAEKEHQKEIIVSDLIDLFKRQSENWGDRFGRILTTLLRAHLDLNIDHNESRSLMDVFDCVTDPNNLTSLINRVEDPVSREQLVRIKEDMGSYELEPLQRRLNDFLENRVTREIVAAEQSGVNFQDAVQQGKIILVNVQIGEVGETVSQLLGSIIITQIWAAAQSRITQPEEQRTPFYLYVDELQNYAGEGSNFTKILSQAREYRLGCWLVTQYLNQLPTDMRRAITNNCRTKLVFDSTGSEDLPRLAKMLQGIDPSLLRSLGDYRAVLQTPGDQQRYNATIIDTYPPWKPETGRDLTQIKQEKARKLHTDTASPAGTVSLGNTANAGGSQHQQLLAEAKQELEQRGGVQVNLLYQDHGDEKPDALISTPTDETAHLEAEHSTLSKPAKVLKNLRRGHQQNREVIFAVETGNQEKLENILSDPVNRNGNQHSDENGTYQYYTDSNGEPVSDIDQLQEAEYRIIEIKLSNQTEPECPELGDFTEKQLREACSLRDQDTGHCYALDQECVLTE
jgi:hypothetical protein